MTDETLTIPAEHPDRHALEYADARIAQYKLRALAQPEGSLARAEMQAATMALAVFRGDLRALLHRPSPIAAICEHPADKQLSDSLPTVGATIRCTVCGEHRPAKLV